MGFPVKEEGDETDLIFIPYGLIAGALVGWATSKLLLRPGSFWWPESVGFFLSVLAIVVLQPRLRRLAHIAMAALTLLGFIVLFSQFMNT
jgi:hypothetical protein